MDEGIWQSVYVLQSKQAMIIAIELQGLESVLSCFVIMSCNISKPHRPELSTNTKPDYDI